jgi:hypothetical protein
MPSTYFVTDYVNLQGHVLSAPRPSTAHLSRNWVGPRRPSSQSSVPHSVAGPSRFLRQRLQTVSVFPAPAHPSTSAPQHADNGIVVDSATVPTPQSVSPCMNTTTLAATLARQGRAPSMLPPGTFVFASFSNFQKLDPTVMGVWCSVLRRTPKSVLWMLRHDGAEVVGVCGASAT